MAKQMNIQPLDDRVLVKQSEAEETTAGGIVLPDSAQEKPQKGKVVSVGKGKLLDDGSRAAFSVKPGDIVFYGKYAGSEVEIDGDKYIIMRENEILAVVE